MIEVITWLDHYSRNDASWFSKGAILEATTEDYIVQTVGILVWEDETRVCIARNVRLDVDLTVPLYQDYTVIYKKLITKRK